jgi:hypothetical protein
VLIKVTEAHKWHVRGNILDRNPISEKVKDNYFGKQAVEEEKVNIEIKKSKSRRSLVHETEISTNQNSMQTNKTPILGDLIIIFGLILMILGILMMN